MYIHVSTKRARLPLCVVNFRGGGDTCGISGTWVLLLLRYQCVISCSHTRLELCSASTRAHGCVCQITTVGVDIIFRGKKWDLYNTLWGVNIEKKKLYPSTKELCACAYIHLHWIQRDTVFGISKSLVLGTAI